MPLEKNVRVTMTAKTTRDLADEKIKALIGIVATEELEDIFKESELSSDDTSMVRHLAVKSIERLVQHVYDGVISTAEFCNMQRQIFRTFTRLVHDV